MGQIQNVQITLRFSFFPSGHRRLLSLIAGQLHALTLIYFNSNDLNFTSVKLYGKIIFKNKEFLRLFPVNNSLFNSHC